MDSKLPEKLTEEEELEFIPIFSELKSLTNNGLIGIDLFRCWVEWNILPLSRRDGLMYEYDGTVNHLQCFHHKRLSESEIVGIIKKLTGDPLEECAKIGLKAFCRSNPVPPVRIQAAFRFFILTNALGLKFTSIHQKSDPFWRRGPKVTAQKTTKPPPKKKKKQAKGKDNESQNDAVEVISIYSDSPSPSPRPARRICGKVPMSHPYAYMDPDFLLKKARYTPKRRTRSHSGDLISGLPEKTIGRKRTNETSPPTSGDSAILALPPMVHVQGAQVKRRKTGDLSSAPKITEALGTSASVPEIDEEQAAAHDILVDDIPDVRDDSPVILKETADKVNPPSPLKVTEDPDDVVVTGTGYSTPPVAVLSKHTSKESRLSPDQDTSKLKFPHYEKLEFDQLCCGFVSHLERDYEMNKSLIHLMKVKHETESALPDLRKNRAEQQDAQSESERKYRLILVELERMKADHQKLEKKAKADQAAILKHAEQAEEKLEATQQELFGLKKHISNMTVAMFGSRAANLPDDCMLKLKSIYTSTEQLYTGGVVTIMAVMGSKERVRTIKHMLGYLFTLPPQIEELKRSAIRKGVLNTVSRCLSYAPELKPEEIAAGYPELKDDGSEFTEVDYHRVIVESCFSATQLATSLDLSKYQAAYDEKKKKVMPPSYQTASLVPRRHKNPFDLDMDLSLFLDDEDEFVALSKCNWKLGDLRIEGGESSRQGDSEAA
ncbi:hypothetical protein ZWY2020_038510 [Hordeum vulgare]|nr:hypothetical protein ZWY2020_038510 [Hordeum vulgare]